MNKIALRDWHNAIVKVAVVDDRQLDIIKKIDKDIDNEELYNELGKIEYTNDNHRYIKLDIDTLFDGYYNH